MKVEQLSYQIVNALSAAKLASDSSMNFAAGEKTRQLDLLTLSIAVQNQFRATVETIILHSVNQTIASIDSLGQVEAALVIQNLSGQKNSLHDEVLKSLLEGLQSIREYSNHQGADE